MAITKDTTTLPGLTIISDDSGSVAIDYSPYFERIATALENIYTSFGGDSSSVSGILNSSTQALESIESQLVSISATLTTTSQSLETISTLASGDGVRMVGPYDWLGYSSLYKLYVEDDGAIGLDALIAYKDKINNLPKAF